MNKRSQKTKARITNSLLTLIETKSTSKITVKEITDLSNIERKTFYLHYSCIDDVYEDIKKKINRDFEEAAQEYINSKDYTVDNLFLYLNKIIMENYNYLKAISKNDSYMYLMDAFKKVLSKVIDELVHDVYKINSNNTKYYINFYSSAIIASYTSWLKDETNLSLEELTSILNRACFLGLNELLKG